MFVLRELCPDWMTAGFETLLRVRVKKGQLYVSARKTENRETRERSCVLQKCSTHL